MANEVEITVKTKDEATATGNRIKRDLIRHGDEAGKGFGKSFGTGMKSSFAGAASVAKTLGIGLLGAVGGIAALGAGAVVLGPKLANMSARLQDLDRKAEAVFVDQLPRVRRWADENKRALGLTSRETVGLAANMADLLKPIGFTAKEATNMSLKFLDLSGALSKWSGGTRSAAEVSEILSAAVLGEREQLKELGIAISEADVQARLAKKGQDDLKGAALAQAEAVATQELIYEKSTDAQKAWAEGGKQAAEAQHALSSAIGEAKEKLITALTPAIQTAIGWLSKNLVPAIQEVATWLSVHLPAAIDATATWLRTRLVSALQDAQVWWQNNKTIVGELANALSVLLIPATNNATESTKQAATASGGLKGSLDRLTIVLLRAAQGFLFVDYTLTGVIAGLATTGIIAGKLFNILGISRHAADSFIKDMQRMKDGAVRRMEEIQREADQLQGAIDSLHGKDIHFTSNIGELRRGIQALKHNTFVGLQHGTSSWRGGPAIVGERGPELVDLPRGARVTPNSALAGAGGRVVLEIRSGGSRLDDLLVEILRKSIRSRGGDVQIVLGT